MAKYMTLYNDLEKVRVGKNVSYFRAYEHHYIRIDKNKVMSDELGDLSTPVAMSLTKHLKTNPVSIADRIKNEIKPINLIQKIEVANPGYINFFVNKNKLMKLTMTLF